MNNKKLISTSVLGAFAIMAIGAWFMIPVGQMEIYGEFIDYTPLQLAERADLIIVGEFVEKKVQTTDERDYPLRAISTLQVSEVLKGDYGAKTIEVIHNGEGPIYRDGYRVDVKVFEGKVDFQYKEKSVLFLDYDEGNVLGDGYYIVSSNFGKYTIDGNDAIGVDSSKDTTLQNLKQIISTRTQ